MAKLMKEKDEIRKELEELAPGLSKIKREQPFQVPPTYFKELSEEILEKARRQPTGPVWLNSLSEWMGSLLTPQRLAWQLAAIAVLVVAGIWIIRSNQQVDDLPNIADLSVEEMQDYVSNNVGEFDVDILLEESNLTYIDVPLLDSTAIEQEYLDEILDDLDLDDLEKLL